MKENLVFFLGGHDAEMLTIKELLTNSNVPKENVFDKNLKCLEGDGWKKYMFLLKALISNKIVEKNFITLQLNY